MWYFHADHHKKTIKVGLNEMIYFYNLCSSKLVTHYVWNDEPICLVYLVGFTYGLAILSSMTSSFTNASKYLLKQKTYMFLALRRA
jgi:zinc transporter ZupT